MVGEVHDDPVHHEGQAALVAALNPTAVVFEMLDPERAAGWDPALASEPEALDAALGWTAVGWPDVALYLPLFEAIPPGAAVIGAAPPSGALRTAMDEGAAAAFGDDAARFGLADPLPPAEQTERERRQAAAHCDALPPSLLPGFVAAQRLRDAAFARATLDALEAHGPPVVLIAGNGHVHADWGVPAALRRAAPDVSVHAVAQLQTPDPSFPADAVVVTGPPAEPRPDPCADFSPPADG